MSSLFQVNQGRQSMDDALFEIMTKHPHLNKSVISLPSTSNDGPLTDDQLFEMMKRHPEFDNLPKPASWFKKYNLEPVAARNFKEFIDDKAWEKSREKFVNEREIRKEPAPGGVRPVLPSEEIPVEIISRPIEPEEVWGLAEQMKRDSKTESSFEIKEILSEALRVTPEEPATECSSR
jgi:hypothetical protein